VDIHIVVNGAGAAHRLEGLAANKFGPQHEEDERPVFRSSDDRQTEQLLTGHGGPHRG